MAAPSMSGVSIASDDLLFGEMLRVAAGGASDCSWQAPRSASKRAGGASLAGAPAAKHARGAAASDVDAPAGGGSGLRCLDPLHAAGCTRGCTAAPNAAQVDQYQLIGDPGLKNGEKKLRALLNKTVEWNNAEAREALARVCDGAGDASAAALAVALRQKACSSLRKQHLFALCGAWGYACNLWHAKEGRRGDAPRGVPAPPHALALAPPAAAPHAAPPAWLAAAAAAPPAPPAPAGPAAGTQLAAPAAATAALAPASKAGGADAWNYGTFDASALTAQPDAAAEHIMAMLRPMALECAWKFEGSRAREAAARLGAEHITPRVVDALSKVTRWLQRLLLEWGQQHAAVLAWARRLATEEGAEEGRQLAWVALAKPGAAFSLDGALALIGSLAQTSVAACAEKARLPDCTPSEAAWLSEFGDGSLMGLEVTVRLQALLAQFKFSSLSTFLGVVSRVLELGMLATNSVAANFTARDAWMRQVLAENQRRAAGEALTGEDTAASAEQRRLAVFEFKNFPERISSGVLLLEPGDSE